MAFVLKLSTDEIREKMFGFIKPVYKSTYDFDFGYINWIYGVYDGENGIFLTYVSSKSDVTKYVLLDERGGIFYVCANSYRHTFTEIPKELEPIGGIIQSGIRLFNDKEARESFEGGFSDEQKKRLDNILENMKDRCRPAVEITCADDAQGLFEKHCFNNNFISRMYNKATVEAFNRYLSEEKMLEIRGEKYKAIVIKILDFGDTLNDEEYKEISEDFGKAGNIIALNADDMYLDITLKAVKKAYFCNVISVGYIGFIEKYIESRIKFSFDRIKELRPILDFINENMRREEYKSLEFYRKELDRLIYNKTDGFQFMHTTDEIREKMFGFLEQRYTYGLDVNNINWTTGVFDKESGIFLTKIYHISDGLARCGIDYNSYIVICGNDIFRIDKDYIYEEGKFRFSIPNQYDALFFKVCEGIEFYEEGAHKYGKRLGNPEWKELREIDDEMNKRLRSAQNKK